MGTRSLFAGVSGLRNFQQQLDLIGNNIANSQTAGYKSSRMTFKDLLSQTSQGATGPIAGTIGGTNPIQIGLGSSLGAIDTDFSQGNLLTTGRSMDLAISGNGFFRVSHGADNFYTRNGAFGIDEAGNLVSTTSGYVAQGFVRQTDGTMSNTVQNIQIPVGIVLPALATTTVDMVGNLDATAQQTGTNLTSGSLLATELTGQTNDINGLYSNGNLDARISGLQPGVSTVRVVTSDGADFTLTYVASDGGASNGQFNSLTNLVQEISAGLTAAGSNVSATLLTTGAIQAHNGAAAARSLNVTSNNASLNSALSGLTSAAIAAGGNTTSDLFAHTATGTDLLTNLRNASGTSLGITAGNTITETGEVGGVANTGSTVVGAGTTLSSFLTDIMGSVGARDVTLNNGSIQIDGYGGTSSALSNLSITNGANATFNALFDSTSGNWSQTQTATDNHTTSFEAFDSTGVSHTVTIAMNVRDPVGNTGQWVYNVTSVTTSNGQPDTITGGTGTVSFNSDGSLNGPVASSVTITPYNGPGGSTGNPIALTMNMGTQGAWDGMVSFENDSSARFANITGYASGELNDVTINSQGVVTGNFTNGQNMTLAQIELYTFDNPSGLEKVGGNMYSPTLNSGIASQNNPGSGGAGTLIPSALEGSNVDLAQQFVDMITAQRGFQSNSRIISTASELLQELVNLGR